MKSDTKRNNCCVCIGDMLILKRPHFADSFEGLPRTYKPLLCDLNLRTALVVEVGSRLTPEEMLLNDADEGDYFVSLLWDDGSESRVTSSMVCNHMEFYGIVVDVEEYIKGKIYNLKTFLALRGYDCE